MSLTVQRPARAAPGPALPLCSSLWSAQPRACLVTALQAARMYLRVLTSREQQPPDATIKGNILHPFQKEPFSQSCPSPVPGMAGIPLSMRGGVRPRHGRACTGGYVRTRGHVHGSPGTRMQVYTCPTGLGTQCTCPQAHVCTPCASIRRHM